MVCDKPTYIYALTEPDFTVRYVGKTVDLYKRYQQHITPSKKERTHKTNWVDSLLRLGTQPFMIELECVPPGEDWAERERYWIAYYRSLGFDLTNATDGGDGQVGLQHSVESREKMSRSHRGRPKSQQMKDRLRKSRTGTKLSKETKQKIAEKAKQRPLPESFIANNAKGRTLSDQQKANISEGLRRSHERKRLAASTTPNERSA